MTETGKRHYLSAASRRESILRAADEVVFKEGVAHLSIVEVARRANISRQLVYQHFADRSALLSDVILRRLVEVHQALGAPGEAADGGIDALLRAQLHRVMNFSPRDRALMRSLFGDLSVLPRDLWPTIAEIRTVVINRWSQVLGPDVQPGPLAQAKLGLVMHAIFGAWDLMADGTLNEVEAVDLVVTVTASLYPAVLGTHQERL